MFPENCDKTDLSQPRVVLLSTCMHISWGCVLCIWHPAIENWCTHQFEAHCWSQRRGRDPWWLRRVCVTTLLWSLLCPGPLQEYSLLAATHQLLVKVPIPFMAGISSSKEESLVWLSSCMWFCFSGCDQEPFMADGAAYMSSLFLVYIAYTHSVKSPGTSWHLWNVKCVCQWGKLNRKLVFLCELTLCYHLPFLVLYKMLCFLTG